MLQYTKCSYSLKVTVHQIFIESKFIKTSSLSFRLKYSLQFSPVPVKTLKYTAHIVLRLQYTNFYAPPQKVVRVLCYTLKF